MKKNVHNYERVFRIAAGAALTSLSFWGPKRPWFLAFLAPLTTGLTGSCPLYSVLGFSTRKTVEDQANDYFPVQSPSEIAAGHPIVGAS